VRLPISPDTSAAKVAIQTVKHPAQSLRVMVVEDNADTADSLSLLLRLFGHEVLVARTGPTALELAPGFKPDVVLLDIGLPGMDGYHAAQRLRTLPEFKSVTICALTGYTPSEADRQRFPQAGFDHYFVKPMDLEILLEMFRTVVVTAS
jgi:two-component system CheB/CheR fusion protein